jgi:hypothetical protein
VSKGCGTVNLTLTNTARASAVGWCNGCLDRFFQEVDNGAQGEMRDAAPGMVAVGKQEDVLLGSTLSTSCNPCCPCSFCGLSMPTAAPSCRLPMPKAFAILTLIRPAFPPAEEAAGTGGCGGAAERRSQAHWRRASWRRRPWCRGGCCRWRRRPSSSCHGHACCRRGCGHTHRLHRCPSPGAGAVPAWHITCGELQRCIDRACCLICCQQQAGKPVG